MWNKLKAALYDSPGWKTTFSILSMVITGVLSGAFIAEITIPSGLEWALFYKSKSFYGLMFISSVLYFYNKGLYKREHEIAKFIDNEYCVAYIRSQCLPEAAERYKELIRNGDVGQLEQAMAEIKKIL